MPFPAALQNALIANGIPNGSPGWIIAQNARLLPGIPGRGPMGQTPVIGDTPAVAMSKLMKSFYDYGRLHFTWSQSSSAVAGTGGLLTGAATSAACAAFNGNLKRLAEACGITGIRLESFMEQFITVPGGQSIDSKWVGNVRTDREGFGQFRSYKFREHYWLSLGGMHYDVCYNNTFHTTEQIVFSRLDQAEPQLLRETGMEANKIYKLRKPLPQYDYLVMVQQVGPGNWPSWQLVSKANLKAIKPR